VLCTAGTVSPRLWHWHTYEALRTAQQPFLSFLPFHGACFNRAHVPSLYFSSTCLSTPLPAVHWIFTSGRVLHWMQSILWLPVEFATFFYQDWLQATSSSPEIRWFPSISFSITPPVLPQQMASRLSTQSFSVALDPPVFCINLPQFSALGVPSVLSWNPLRCRAALLCPSRH